MATPPQPPPGPSKQNGASHTVQPKRMAPKTTLAAINWIPSASFYPPARPPWGVGELANPTVLASTALAGFSVFAFTFLYRRFWRRLPNSAYITPSSLGRRRLFGRVTSVGDGDNFRVFHTPGGRWTGWGWVRTIPSSRSALKDNTVHIRLAGVDAPELPHFGRPGQPFGDEAKQWLTSYIKDRNVKVNMYRADQYNRIVGTAYVRRGLFWRDIGHEMLKAGYATVYEAQTGAEFGGKEDAYRKTTETAKKSGRGMWAKASRIKTRLGIAQKVTTETPGQFKQRMRVQQ